MSHMPDAARREKSAQRVDIDAKHRRTYVIYLLVTHAILRAYAVGRPRIRRLMDAIMIRAMPLFVDSVVICL